MDREYECGAINRAVTFPGTESRRIPFCKEKGPPEPSWGFFPFFSGLAWFRPFLGVM